MAFTKQLYDCFFAIPGPRFFIPDTLPIPLPYYWLLVPGFALALWQKRFEIPLLATIPIAGAFIARAIFSTLFFTNSNHGVKVGWIAPKPPEHN
jgi:hypothetical protein